MAELREDIIERIRIKSELAFIKEIRVNYSKQADDVVSKIKKGAKPTSADYFILQTTDQDKIDNFLKFETIREKISKGRIEYQDIDFLVGSLGDIGEFDKALKQAFYKKIDEQNLNYANEHPDEFSNDEIEEMKRKLESHKTMKEIVEENLMV